MDKGQEGSSPTQGEGDATVFWGNDQGPVVGRTSGGFRELSDDHRLSRFFFLLPLENLLWAKLPDYAISRVNPNPRQAFLM